VRDRNFEMLSQVGIGVNLEMKHDSAECVDFDIGSRYMDDESYKNSMSIPSSFYSNLRLPFAKG